MTFISYVTLSTIMLYMCVLSQHYDNVVQLRNDVLTGYDKTVRPVLNQADLMHVNITYDILVIPEINEVQGTMTVVMQLNYAWIDERIKWNPYFYNNTDILVLSANAVWKPELVLITSADPELSLDSGMNTVRYYPNGVAIWYPTSAISVSCLINIEFYPFDTQKCSIDFMAVDYFPQELKLHAVNNEASLQYYIDNGIWDLVRTESRAFEQGVPSYTVTLTVTRKPNFIVIIVVIPIMLLSLMSIMVFLLPPESGERMSYSITLLLALMVFLTIVSDNIPKTSRPLSLLSYFIGLHVLLSALITFATILNLRLYYKDEKDPVPSWLCFCCRKHDAGQQFTPEGYTIQGRQQRDPVLLYETSHQAKECSQNRRHSGVLKAKSFGGYIDGNNRQLHRTFGDDQPRMISKDGAKTELTWKGVSRIADWIMLTSSVVYYVVVFIVFALIAILRT